MNSCGLATPVSASLRRSLKAGTRGRQEAPHSLPDSSVPRSSWPRAAGSAGGKRGLSLETSDHLGRKVAQKKELRRDHHQRTQQRLHRRWRLGRSDAGSLAPRTPTATLGGDESGAAGVSLLLLSGVNPSSPASDSAGKRRSRSRGTTSGRYKDSVEFMGKVGLGAGRSVHFRPAFSLGLGWY